jgi:hypothetical protein
MKPRAGSWGSEATACWSSRWIPAARPRRPACNPGTSWPSSAALRCKMPDEFQAQAPRLSGRGRDAARARSRGQELEVTVTPTEFPSQQATHTPGTGWGCGSRPPGAGSRSRRCAPRARPRASASSAETSSSGSTTSRWTRSRTFREALISRGTRGRVLLVVRRAGRNYLVTFRCKGRAGPSFRRGATPGHKPGGQSPGRFLGARASASKVPLQRDPNRPDLSHCGAAAGGNPLERNARARGSARPPRDRWCWSGRRRSCRRTRTASRSCSGTRAAPLRSTIRTSSRCTAWQRSSRAWPASWSTSTGSRSATCSSTPASSPGQSPAASRSTARWASTTRTWPATTTARRWCTVTSGPRR